jgi:hypothetical protein
MNQNMLFGDQSHAIFSPCGQYRYVLWRKWSDRPKVMFVGLNPSTANATSDDPTIRRVKRFAQDWGYGGVYMLNLFAIVSPYPRILKTHPDPLGANNEWLIEYARKSEAICFAWGNFKEASARAKEVASMFPNGICLGVNKNGTPKHPLYVPANSERLSYHSIVINS